MDRLERTVGLFTGYFALLLAIMAELARNYQPHDLIKHVKGKPCPSGFTQNLLYCEKVLPAQVAANIIFGALIGIFALSIVIFALRRKRSGVIASNVFLFLILYSGNFATAGFLFVFVAIWLMIRAYRLQKYGSASANKSRLAAKERKEGRSAPSADSPIVKPAPEASKRYTPKQRKRRR